MDENESTARAGVDWQPFIDALCSAASMWDNHLGWRQEGAEVVPISPAQAEDVMRAIALLAQRMSAATASIVYATAEVRLDALADAEGVAEDAETLSLVALHAEAMRRAAELALAAVERQNPV